MSKPVLVIMAAGMGSRYGGLKQIDPVDEQGNLIIDFSIYDAIKAGFKKVIFIIKPEIEADFKKMIGDRISQYVETEYIYQSLENIPEGYSVPEGREKPWGTGHAVLCSIDKINGPFAVINADDYYGSHAFQMLYDGLIEAKDDTLYRYMMVGYTIENTLTENGHVARGVCEVTQDGMLEKIQERTHIEKKGNDTMYTEDDGKTWVKIPEASVVSMNMWGFSQSLLMELKNRFICFMNNNVVNNPLKSEYFLPSVVSDLLNEGKATVKVVKSEDKWYGVTYKADKETVVNAIRKFKAEGIYPEQLWPNKLVEDLNVTRDDYCAKIHEAIEAIDFSGEYIQHERYGDGHINDTFLIQFKQKDETVTKYILQRMNHQIFRNPDQLIANISSVTSFLRKRIIENQGDINRETLNLVYTKSGTAYYKDSIGSYWRAYLFIDDATCFNQVKKPEDFYQSAYAFGRFQKLLSDFDANSLYETIPDFHNTPKRFKAFQEAVKKDSFGRAEKVKDEIQFILDREQDTKICTNYLKMGELPLRVTHNDTKLNNVMIDNKTGKGMCVIDLDTVMPGLSINDFGDSIRFGANTAVEDETDLTKVSLSLELFEAFANGFLDGCGGSLTSKELELLPMGAKLMTLECGMRFLTDYLEGDTYFKIHREEHNRDRCRTQLKLVEDMECKMIEMNRIIENIVKKSQYGDMTTIPGKVR